jgi:hypothetical protein
MESIENFVPKGGAGKNEALIAVKKELKDTREINS